MNFFSSFQYVPGVMVSFVEMSYPCPNLAKLRIYNKRKPYIEPDNIYRLGNFTTLNNLLLEVPYNNKVYDLAKMELFVSEISV